MPWRQPVSVTLDEEMQKQLAKLVTKPSTPQQIALRGKIIQAANEGKNNGQIARLLAVDIDLVRKWRLHWHTLQAIPLAQLSMYQRLEDKARSGKPSKYTQEQICQITALACERPADQSLRPISQWSNREIADEVIKRGIVSFISPRQVGRFLKRS